MLRSLIYSIQANNLCIYLSNTVSTYFVADTVLNSLNSFNGRYSVSIYRLGE